MDERQKQLAAERIRRFEERHPGRIREIKAKYQAAHRAEHSRRSADRLNAKRRADPEAARERDRANRAAEPEARRAYERAYYAATRDQRMLVIHRRRARRAGAGQFTVTLRDWKRLVARHDHRCAYCGSMGPLQQDHVIPIARGGRHSIGNLVPACGPCNRRKWQMLLVEWRNGRVIAHSRVARAA